MQLFFEPIDVWLFRDGRPFNAADDHRAETIFPPFPTVLQGAIRSHRLVQLRPTIDLRDKAAVRAAVGTADDFRKLRLRGPLIAKREGAKTELYFPLPADVVARRGGTFRVLAAEVVPQGTREDSTFKSSSPHDVLLMPPPDELEGNAEGRWLSQMALTQYLAEQPFTGTARQTLYETEPRPGIGMNHQQRVTDQGLLYEVAFARPLPNVGLYIELHGYEEWKTSGVLRLGGESRAAHYSEVQIASLPWPKAGYKLPKHFKIYFATPTYFEGGSVPLDSTWSKFFNGKVKLRTVAINGYDSIGGYDLANDQHKPARRYVPAGSVYYFTCLEESVTLRAHPTADTPPDFVAMSDYGSEIGFGHFFITDWKGI